MSNALRVLIIEDSGDDALLLCRHLQRAGRELAWERVETGDAFRAALQRASWDVVLADYTLPRFGVSEALAILRETGFDLPFIVVSGSVGEDRAVAALKAGAHDFVLKMEMSRLDPAIEREVREAAHRRARRQAERALAEREAHLRALLENAADGIFTLDEGGKVATANPAAERMFGWPAAEMVGRDVGALVPGDWQEAVGMGPRELVGRRRTGAFFPIELSLSEMRMDDRRLFIGIARDVAERRLVERQLQQAQRMDSIARLTGGIAHDFNNILMGIVSYAHLAQARVPGDHPVWSDLSEITKQSGRAAALVRRLLAFSRRQPLDLRKADLNRVITDMERFLRRVIGENVDVRVVQDQALATAAVDTGQIEQAILNLCVNARDAMPSGGRLLIETKNAELDPGFCVTRPWARPGRFVRVSVADTGMGMGRDTLQKLFEPFFTTKAPGKGTGLGLAVVHGIVEQHEGFIHVESEPGQGSTFSIYLPAVEGAPEAPASERASPPRGQGETILVAEDDDIVRRVVVRLLESHGYSVVSAADGEEALRVFDQASERVRMAILDVKMPRLGGYEACRALRAKAPSLKLLLISGYGADAVRTGQADDDVPAVQKPVDPWELMMRVHEALRR